MSQDRRWIFNQEFKLAAVQRMLAGENVCALAPQKRGPKTKGTIAWAAPTSAASIPPPLSPSRPPAGDDALTAAQARIA
jgi:hypothetical protein